MKLSIIKKIFFGVVLVQLFSAALMLGWYYYSIKSEFNQFVIGNAQDTVLRSIEVTEEYISPAETAIQAAQYLISSEILNREQPEQFVRYFDGQLKLWPQFAGLYVGFPNGDFYYVMRSDKESANGTRTKIIRHLDGQREVSLKWRDADNTTLKTANDPDDTYDPRARPWYSAALATSKVAWTNPYIFFSSRKPGITAAVAVGKGTNKTAAVVGIDIEINEVSNYLGQIALGPRRSAFVVSPEGEIISHSDLDTVLSDNDTENDKPRFIKITELEGIDPAIRDDIVLRLADQSTPDVPAVWEKQTDDGDYIIAVGQISNANWPWRVVTVLPETDVIGATSGSDWILVGIILLATTLAITIGYLLASSIGQPLTILLTNAKLARNGNIELMEEVASGYEEIDGTDAALVELGEIRRSHGPLTPS